MLHQVYELLSLLKIIRMNWSKEVNNGGYGVIEGC